MCACVRVCVCACGGVGRALGLLATILGLECIGHAACPRVKRCRRAPEERLELVRREDGRLVAGIAKLHQLARAFRLPVHVTIAYANQSCEMGDKKRRGGGGLDFARPTTRTPPHGGASYVRGEPNKLELTATRRQLTGLLVDAHLPLGEAHADHGGQRARPSSTLAPLVQCRSSAQLGSPATRGSPCRPWRTARPGTGRARTCQPTFNDA